LANGGGQLVQGVLVERRPWLARVGRDGARRHFGEVGPLDRLGFADGRRRRRRVRRPHPGHRRLGLAGADRGRDKRPESLAEPTPLLSHYVSLIHHLITPQPSCQVTSPLALRRPSLWKTQSRPLTAGQSRISPLPSRSLAAGAAGIQLDSAPGIVPG